MKIIKDIISLIDDSIKDDTENNLMSWNIIKDGYNTEVDSYRNMLNNSKDWLSDYQWNLIKKYNINSLKIKYTNAWGYFIEIPKSQISKIPDFFIQKQTLVNASRYITIELKEFEQKFLEAENNLAELEYSLFNDVREKILNWYDEIKNISEKTAYLDFIAWLSSVAYNNDYTKPEFLDNSDLIIKWWRHPVIEKNVDNFISNDLLMNNKSYVNIITWPNMWWKSTFLRQNAIIILLAHIWSYVPAKSLQLWLFDRIFSRVWAQDNLYLWQSTFMVEMQEVANIMNNSTNKSFVIIDEVWRGTSTYDWMSLAWSILKEIHDNINAKTLFATHYHELIDKSISLKWVDNFSVSVWDNNWELVFLRKIVKWWIKKSYWLEVAKLAGINKHILDEAKKMLKTLELEHNNIKTNQMSLWEIIEPEIKIIEKEILCKSIVEQDLDKIDINNLTPMEALNILSELKWKITK